jgi:hypothetical protein
VRGELEKLVGFATDRQCAACCEHLRRRVGSARSSEEVGHSRVHALCAWMDGHLAESEYTIRQAELRSHCQISARISWCTRRVEEVV